MKHCCLPTERIVKLWQKEREDASRYTLLNDFGGKRIYRFSFEALERVGESALPETIIVKTWRADRGTWFHRLKRRTVGQLSGCENEFKMLRHLAKAAPELNAPSAFARFGSERVLGELGEVVLMSDIGESQRLIDFLSEAARSGRSDRILELQNFIIESVRAMIFSAKIVDEDHTLINMVRSFRTGAFHRIDFEIARRLDKVRDRHKAIGVMLGEILITHAFGCQPRTEYTTDLARALRNALPELDQKVWIEAHGRAHLGIQKQREVRGIATHLDLSPIEFVC